MANNYYDMTGVLGEALSLGEKLEQALLGDQLDAAADVALQYVNSLLSGIHDEAMAAAEEVLDLHDLLDNKAIRVSKYDLGNGAAVESVEWAEGPADYFVIDPLLENGEVDYENTKWFGPDGLPLIDGKTTIERKAESAGRAAQFMQELLDSVETLLGIAETHGPRTLVDLMYLQQAILKDECIDHHPGESNALDIARSLPSGAQWAKFINVNTEVPEQVVTPADSFLLADGWLLANDYTKNCLPGAIYMRTFGGKGTPYVTYDLTIVKSDYGTWIPVHGTVKMPAVDTPEKAAEALISYWHDVPEESKLAAVP